MKNSFIITVPEPCHEDWNQMRPEDRGRFCSSCCKTVVDFSQMSDTGIAEYLAQSSTGKLCGRFKQTQLSRPLTVTVTLDELPHNMSITHRFVLALFLVFGSMLFSCTGIDNNKIGKVEVQREERLITGMMIAQVPDSEKTAADCEYPVMGDFEAYYDEPEDSLVAQVKGEVSSINILPTDTIEVSMTTSGLFEIETFETPDCVINEQDPKPDVVPSMPDVPLPDQPVPEPVQQDDPPVQAVAVLPAVSDRTNIETPQRSLMNELELFPVPASNEVTVAYTLNENADVEIRLLSSSGALLRRVAALHMQHAGNYRIPLDVSGLVNGLYFVRWSSGEIVETRQLIVSH
jgi:hypothetical protein